MSGGSTPGRRLRSGLVRATLSAVVGLAILSAVALWMAMRPPVWWSPIAVDAAVADRGAAFEQAIVAEFTRVRERDAVWAIRIPAPQVNDWLAARLPEWLASRDLPPTGRVQASMGAGVLRVGMQRGGFVAWTSATPVADQGGIRLDSVWSGVGRIPVPIASGGLAGVGEVGPGRVIPLPDGRRVRVLDLELLEGELRLRLKTEGR